MNIEYKYNQSNHSNRDLSLLDILSNLTILSGTILAFINSSNEISSQNNVELTNLVLDLINKLSSASNIAKYFHHKYNEIKSHLQKMIDIVNLLKSENANLKNINKNLSNENPLMTQISQLEKEISDLKLENLILSKANKESKFKEEVVYKVLRTNHKFK